MLLVLTGRVGAGQRRQQGSAIHGLFPFLFEAELFQMVDGSVLILPFSHSRQLWASMC